MLSLTQKMFGVNSIADKIENLHYVFWDMDNCTLEQAEETLECIQTKYKLSDIFICSDWENSFRAWCFSKVDYNTMLKILLETRYVDKGFFRYAVTNNKATLRTSDKEGREQKQEIVSILRTYPQPIPETFNYKEYDTSLGKKSINIFIGDKN
jgi:predicted aldo/keto reductase-like oxidoreductase